MTNQQFFDMISELEEMLFYIDSRIQAEDTAAAHDLSRNLLESFAKQTGCRNQ